MGTSGARIAGKIRGKAPLEIAWTPPKWDWVDPVKEVAATRDEIAGGLASLSEKLRARGFDPEIVFAEIGQDVAALSEAAGIPRELVFQILFQSGKPLPGNQNPVDGNATAGVMLRMGGIARRVLSFGNSWCTPCIVYCALARCWVVGAM